MPLVFMKELLEILGQDVLRIIRLEEVMKDAIPYGILSPVWRGGDSQVAVTVFGKVMEQKWLNVVRNTIELVSFIIDPRR